MEQDMTLKQYYAWCNRRACDGKWGMEVALYCFDLATRLHKAPFWRRQKLWGKEKKNLRIDAMWARDGEAE